jgi:thiol-disulfide isomerase/thioredoxin
VIPVDIDGDGDLDLVTLGLQGLRLMENRLPREGRHFARVRLRATRSQHHALGANVVLESGGVRQQDYVKATAGFQTQVPWDLHFGLADASRIDRIEIRWPSGAIESHRDLPADRLLVITEGEAPEARKLPAWPADRPRPLETYDAFARAGSVDGGLVPLAERGRPVVINFWAPWCKPCAEELPVLRALHDEFRAKVSFAGVSVETSDEDGVRRAIAEQRVDYPQFFASEALLASFFGGDEAAALPATFVFDAQGSLRRAFYRAVRRDDLAPLLESLLDERPVAPDLVALAFDAALRGDYEKARGTYQQALAAEPGNVMAAVGLATLAYEENKVDESIRILLGVTHHDPWQRRAWEVLALCYAVQGIAGKAIESCRHATEIAATSNCLPRIATTLLDGGNAGRAADVFNMIVKSDPLSADAWIGLGRARARLGQVAEAADALRRALRIRPDDPVVKRLLTQLVH